MLWSDRGDKARDYLAGRGLAEATIREARLGYCPGEEWFERIFSDRKAWVPRGSVIPWFDRRDVALINVRRPKGDPKYVAILGSRRGGLSPGRARIVTGKPLIIVEGEFDALLLHQELGGSPAVVTVGSASAKPIPRVKNAMLGAFPWIVAGDADEAGEKSADGWLSRSDRCVRIAPPAGSGKDWTEAHQKGPDLRAWWLAKLEKIAVPSTPLDDPQASQALKVPTAQSGISEGFSIVDGVLAQDPPASSWQETLLDWTDDWRLRWGALANAYSHAGMGGGEAGTRAMEEVLAERKAANGGPPQVMDPDPHHTALYRDFVDEMRRANRSAWEARHPRPATIAEPLEVLGVHSDLTTLARPHIPVQSGAKSHGMEGVNR